MKKPNKLIGYIQYNNSHFPFSFNEEEFTVTLYPPSIELWRDLSSPHQFFSQLTVGAKTHEWIKNDELHGITADHKYIIFNIQDSPSNYNGFRSYKVNWYFYYSQSMNRDNISGFKLFGAEIDYFYPSNQALHHKVDYHPDTHNIKKISVDAMGPVSVSCGKYRVARNIDALMEASAYGVVQFGNNPITSESAFTTSFSKPVSLDVLLSSYFNLIRFFEYITYRKNITFDSVHVFCLNEDNKRENSGLLVFKKRYEDEDDERAHERIIPFSILKKKTGMIFSIIKNNKLGFQHLCESIEDMRSYAASRIIMIFAEFEREYRNIYGKDYNRSTKYLEVKNAVSRLINQYASSLSGKSRSYAKQIQKYVENRDHSFEMTLKTAFLECKTIMTPFASAKYDGIYEEIIDGLCERMGGVRNGIAHSHLDLTLDAIHLSDIKMIEELLYAMRLKKFHIIESDIQIAIKKIFNENITI